MIKRVLIHPVTQNAIALYAVQAANVLLPLMTVPYLARVLGPSEWGLVVFAQSLAAWISLIVQYGFRLSATREIARQQGDRQHVRMVAGNVLGGQALLVTGSFFVALVVFLLVPAFARNELLMAATWILSLAIGLNPFWYFQGVERMRTPALFTVFGALLSTAGVFLLVGSGSRGAEVILIQAAGAGVTALLSFLYMFHEIRPSWPSLKGAVHALRTGFAMFLYQTSVSLYTTANAFILGLFVSPTLVGFYGSAERICRAVLRMLVPVTSALYPRINRLASSNRPRASQVAAISLVLMAFGGLMLGGLLALFAPQIVNLMFGQKYVSVVPVLRILSIMTPLIALSSGLGVQWMLPLGLERALSTIIVSAGLLNLGLAVLLARPYGPEGMAAAVVGSEAFVTISMLVVLTVGGNLPRFARHTRDPR